MKKVWIILFAVTLVLALTACGGSQPAATSDQANQNNNANPTENANNGTVMQTGSSADFDFAVTGVNRYDLSDGSQLIVIDCAVTNKSDESHSISSLMSFSAADTSGTDLDTGLDGLLEVTGKGIDVATMDGNVAAGSTLTGAIYFSAPEGTLVDSVTFSQLLSDDKITLQLGGV